MGVSRPSLGIRGSRAFVAFRRTSLFWMCKLIREDWHRHDKAWASPGFFALATHRFGNWVYGLPHWARPPFAFAYRALYLWARNVYGIELPRTTVVGRRLLIGHQHGIVIHYDSRIGDDCVIRQNVTLGAAMGDRPRDAPVLGNGVELGAGAVLIGRIRVGDGARIGPNAVVTRNVAAGATVFAQPPRVVSVHRTPPAEKPAQRPRDAAGEGAA